MDECDPAWLSSEEQHRCLGAAGQFPTGNRLDDSNLLSKITCGFYFEKTHFLQGFLKGQLHRFLTYNLWFWFGKYINMKGIKPPVAFSILKYHSASRWKFTPDEIIWRRFSPQMVSFEALLEWVSSGGDLNTGKTERGLTCTIQNTVTYRCTPQTRLISWKTVKSLKPFQSTINHEKFQN